MNTFDAIRARRSIRRFKPEPVPMDMLRLILEAATLAPSAKNRQPWHFTVVTEKEKDAMIGAMREGLQWWDTQPDLDANDQMLVKGAWHTLSIMEQAPVTIFIVNPHGRPPEEPLAPYGDRFFSLANVQSIGAAIENMCLAATAQGLGSLWIADVYSAYDPLMQWLGVDGELVAALSIGYPDEAPEPRGRRTVDAVTHWR